MEDLDILWDNSLELDFIRLLEQGYTKDMFETSAKIMIGDDWLEVGREILKGEDKSLMEKLNSYAD